MSWPAAGIFQLNRQALNTKAENVGMLSRTHAGTFGACGARSQLGEAYRRTPLGSGLGSHPHTINLPRRAAADHTLPKVPFNDGLSDELHAARNVTTLFIKARI